MTTIYSPRPFHVIAIVKTNEHREVSRTLIIGTGGPISTIAPPKHLLSSVLWGPAAAIMMKNFLPHFLLLFLLFPPALRSSSLFPKIYFWAIDLPPRSSQQRAAMVTRSSVWKTFPTPTTRLHPNFFLLLHSTPPTSFSTMRRKSAQQEKISSPSPARQKQDKRKQKHFEEMNLLFF